jgi:hypothetical protein
MIIESLVLNAYSQTADFTLMLRSTDLDWKVAGNGKSEADLILSTASLDKGGEIPIGRRESLTIRQILGMQQNWPRRVRDFRPM